MTDDLPEPGRLDLRALADPADPSQADRAVRAALARAAFGALPVSRAPRVTPLLATAALLLLGAAALLFAPRRNALEEPANLIAGWTADGYVPSNGELLAAFRGYQP